MMYPNCMPIIYHDHTCISSGSPDILLLYYVHKMPKSEKGDNSVTYLQKFAKS